MIASQSGGSKAISAQGKEIFKELAIDIEADSEKFNNLY